LSDVAASIARADAALRGGDIAAAERALGPALATPSPAAEALLLMAEVRRLQGRLIDAEAFARRAAAVDPRSGRAAGRLGAILQVLQRYAEAREAYEDALRREPALNPVRLNYVRCLVAMGAHEDATAEAALLIARQPSVAAYILQSDSLRASRRAQDALAAADNALALAPGDRSAQLAKARALEAVGRMDDAIQSYRALTGSIGSAPSDALDLARALDRADRSEEAKAALEQALTRWAHDEQILASLCRIRWATGVGETFAEPILNALKERPGAQNLRLCAADLAYRAEQFDVAERLLREGLAYDANDAVLMSSLGVLLDYVGRPEEALAQYDEALRRRPSDERIAINRVSALIRLTRAEEALAALRPLRQNRPNAQDLIALEATALRLRGDPAYRRVYDYDRYVRTYTLAPPSGYDSIEAFNAELGERLRQLHRRTQHPLDQSLRNGTQTIEDLALSTDPVIRAFIAALDAPISDYIAKLPNDPDDPMGRRKTSGHRIWGCWSVRLRPSGFHVNHVHPEGWISSSYYVDVPARQEGDAEHAGWIKFGEPDLPVPGCDPELFIEPAPGKLVLFPSYMWHGTVPFTHGERLTAPFDVVPA
jgi:tetratricopeptide (TPR) repeat protein